MEKVVEEDRRKAQQANDLASNTKRSLLAGKKSKSNSRSFMGRLKNKSKISARGLQHHSTVAGKKSYAAAAMSSTPVSPPSYIFRGISSAYRCSSLSLTAMGSALSQRAR